MSRTVVVTGAAGGIGGAVCDAFEADGWSVVPIDLVPTGRENGLVLDISDADATARALSSLGTVDALVNNAAMQLFKPLQDITDPEWDEVQAVNSRAPFTCMRALRGSLCAARGSVVNVASVHGLATSQNVSAYAASKGALLAFTRAAALELGPHGVRVNAVVPGAVDTPALRSGLGRSGDSQSALRKLIAQTPLARVGTPSDIARAVTFLADAEQSGFVTGQQLIVDGGVLARLASE